MKSRESVLGRYGVNFLAFVLLAVFVAGCATRGPDIHKMNEEQAATIRALNDEVARLNKELDEMMSSREDLAKAKTELEEQLKTELSSGDMSVSMQARGLVVTVLDRILFDSGKADLKTTSLEALDKVAGILVEKVGDHMVYVEGHTDNVPIRYSGWRSNWELSTGRAAEVVHYFVEQKGLNPQRLAMVGYGEYQPLVSNDTPENRLKNRRVEIVISPKKV